MPIPDTPGDVVQLRRAVERCLSLLGTGILQAPANARLRERLFEGALDPQCFGRQLQIRLLQIVAWCMGERLGAVPSSGASPEASAEYERRYSSSHLSLEPHEGEARDLETLGSRLNRVLHGLWQSDSPIAVSPFHSSLFDPTSIADIAAAVVLDAHAQKLVSIIRDEIIGSLPDGHGASVDVQVLGRVHEWSLQLRPFLNHQDRSVAFETAPGHERRTTGSYFTPQDLVENLVDLVIDPQLDERVAGKTGEQARSAILSLRVVDPACGTGVFLLAAAKRIARRLVAYRGESAPGCELRPELSEVIARCIYGVDIGETTVQLCRLALWFELGAPFDPRPEVDGHILCGNSVFGAWPESLRDGIPDNAFTPGPADDARMCKVLKRRNRQERAQLTPTMVAGNSERLADLWCSAFVWPKVDGESVPTHASFAELTNGVELPADHQHAADLFAKEYHFFHWHLRFPDVFGGSIVGRRGRDMGRRGPDPASDAVVSNLVGRRAGFDVVIGNPPWVAHAGRSTQSLAHGLKNCLVHTYTSFSGYPTTHGVFVEMAARILALGGRLGLIVPASVADLDGYVPTRAAHDALCELSRPLPDYGEGRFTGVTQPCVALVSRRTVEARRSMERGQPWPLERKDLDPIGLALLARWARLPTFPAELFGEKGFQSTPELRAHIRRASGPEGRFTLPLREGSDIREFQLGRSHMYADPRALQGVLRPLTEFAQVALVVRQTARYPIAARNDGLAFRNSLLAVLSHDIWRWPLILCLLNSSLFRWCHFNRYRDGRQPILPQLKVGHLRSLPVPVRQDADTLRVLEEIGICLAARNQGIDDSERASLDECVARIYELNPEEHALVTAWHSHRPR